VKSVTDIFNAGRLVFYPAAGAFVVVPFYLLAAAFLGSPAATFGAQLSQDFARVTSTTALVVLFLASITVGFLIAVIGFRVIKRVADAAPASPGEGINPVSFNYNYPLLRQKKDEDYATWLVGEYFRYVEIATYIPMGIMVGLELTTLYLLVFLVRQFAADAVAGLTSGHVLLPALLVASIVTRGYLWPEVWIPRIITPTVRTFDRAKCNLIEGVKAVERAVGPFKDGQAAAAADSKTS